MDNKLRARIARMEQEAEKKKPKGFQLRTMTRAKRVAEEGKRRREAAAQAHATPVPTYAAKHERPFSCFFRKSDSTSNIYQNGLAMDSSNSMLASNAGIRNFAVSQSHSNLRASPQQPVWTVNKGEPYLHTYADNEATMLSSKSQTSFKNVRVMDKHVHKMHTGDNHSTRKESCSSCQRGAKNHCWPENRKIKIPSKPRYPRFLKRIARKKCKTPRKSLGTASSLKTIGMGAETNPTPTQ